jgi:periplasmic copper chaperone A
MMRLLQWMSAPGLLILSALPSHSHPGLQPREARIGAPYRAVVSIPHGCEGAATVKVRVVIPEGVIAVKPMPKPGWTISAVRGPYAHSYPFYHGQTLSEGVKEIAWSGKLADDYFDEFTFAAFLSDTLPAGQMLYFPTYQQCEKGEWQWTQVPALGEDGHALATPAPGIKLLPAVEKASSERKAYKLAALLIEGPWTRATPGGVQVAAGYLKITNSGSQPDRLIGGSLEGAAALEVHEMAMADGVMKMRRLDGGLEIPAGKTIELKPGSYHLMFTGLRESLIEGRLVKGRLTFEKAGTIDVEFQVAPIGAQSGGHSHH